MEEGVFTLTGILSKACITFKNAREVSLRIRRRVDCFMVFCLQAKSELMNLTSVCMRLSGGLPVLCITVSLTNFRYEGNLSIRIV